MGSPFPKLHAEWSLVCWSFRIMLCCLEKDCFKLTKIIIIFRLIIFSPCLAEIGELVRQWLVVDCGPRKMVVTLPRWMADRIVNEGRLVMSIMDHPDCSSVDNGTHLVLSARLDGCGFWKEVNRHKGLFLNEVSGRYGIVVHCTAVHCTAVHCTAVHCTLV